MLGNENVNHDVNTNNDLDLMIALVRELSHAFSIQSLTMCHLRYYHHNIVLSLLNMTKVYEALNMKQWKDAIEEELQALKKMRHGKLWTYLRGRKQLDGTRTTPSHTNPW